MTGFAEAQARLLQASVGHFETRRVACRGPVRHAHVIEAGSGPTLLLVHGGGGFASQWAPLMARLRADHRLLAVDRPGFGLTDPFSYVAPLDLRAHAVAFLEGVLDALELERATIVANSMGALWSLWLALDRPHRVERLVLAGAPAMLLGSSAPLRLRVETHPRVRPLLRRWPPGRGAARRVYDRMRDPVDDPAYLDAVLASWSRPGAADAFAPLVRQVMGVRGARLQLGAAELERVGAPTRLVWGADDPFAPPGLARRAAELLPRGELFVVRGGHLPWLTSPGDVAQLVREAVPARAPGRAAPEPCPAVRE